MANNVQMISFKTWILMPTLHGFQFQVVSWVFEE